MISEIFDGNGLRSSLGGLSHLHVYGFGTSIPLVSMLTSPITTRPVLGVCDDFGVGLGLGIAIAPISGSYFGVGVANGIGRRAPSSIFFEKAAKTDSPAKNVTIRDNAAVAIIDARCFTLAQPTGQSWVRIVPSARR